MKKVIFQLVLAISIINITRYLFLVGSDDSNWQRLESPDIIDLQNAAMTGNESKIYFSGRTSGSAWDIHDVNPN